MLSNKGQRAQVVVVHTAAEAINSRLTLAGGIVFVALGVLRALCATRVQNKTMGREIGIHGCESTRGKKKTDDLPR